MDDIKRVRIVQKSAAEKERAFQAVFQNPVREANKKKDFSSAIWKTLLILCVLGIIGVGGWSLYNKERAGGEKVLGSAVQQDTTDKSSKTDRSDPDAGKVPDGQVNGAGGAGTSYRSDMADFEPQIFYSAVLSDGKVYFGKVRGVNTEHYIMEEVFYERSRGGQAATVAQDPDTRNKTVLVKLGTEAYQPEDVVYVQKSKVLSISPLGQDSAIVKAIRGYLDNDL